MFPPERPHFAPSCIGCFLTFPLGLLLKDHSSLPSLCLKLCWWKAPPKKFLRSEKFHRSGLLKQYFSWTGTRISPLCTVPVGFTQQLICRRCNEKLCERQWMRKLIGERPNNILTYPEAPDVVTGRLLSWCEGHFLNTICLPEMAAVIIFRGQTKLLRLSAVMQSPLLELRESKMPALPPQASVSVRVLTWAGHSRTERWSTAEMLYSIWNQQIWVRELK